MTWRLQLGKFLLKETSQFIELIEPIGSRYVDRIDQTAGPQWMPAARENRVNDH